MSRAPRPGRPPLWLLGLVLGFLVALWVLREALMPFFVAMVLAYLLLPLVERLARRVRRPLAVLAVLAVTGGLLALVLWLLVPWLVDQAARMVDSMPAWRRAIEARVGPWMETHPWLAQKVRDGIEGFDPMVLVSGLRTAGAGVLQWFLRAVALVLVPVILYFLLMDGHLALRALEDLIPPRHRERVGRMAAEIHRRLGGYIRGQVGVALAMSLLQGIGLAVMGVPYAWLLGLVAGFSNFVPYSPYITALPPALLLLGLGGASPLKLVVAVVVFAGIQKAEALYFTPVWVGRSSSLHPLEVLLAVLAFGFAFGLLGLVFAVPLMIVVKVAFEELRKDYQDLTWFRGE